jgi:hypothetical protein
MDVVADSMCGCVGVLVDTGIVVSAGVVVVSVVTVVGVTPVYLTEQITHRYTLQQNMVLVNVHDNKYY